MEWFKLAANYADDPKIVAVGEQAELLFIRALAYCARAETSGKLTRTSLERLGFTRVMRRVEKLVNSGLWTEVEDGWRITRWDEWQSELDALAARRNSDRERKRAQREREAAAKAKANAQSSRDSHADTSRDKEGQSRDGHVTVTPGEGEVEKPTNQSDSRPPERTVPSPRSGGADGRPKGSTADVTHEAEAVALLAALEPARLRPSRRTAESLAVEVAQLLALGWPAEELRTRMTENALADIRNLGGFLRSRLPEPTRYQPDRTAQPDKSSTPGWCGECEESTRLIDTGQGFDRCPDCHPAAHVGKDLR